MADITSLIAKVRVELGDIGKSFVMQFKADGTTNRFKLHYAPVDGASVVVQLNGVDISDSASVEESTGVLVLDELPEDMDELLVSGTYFRYFTDAELTSVITDAVEQHGAKHTDSIGRKISITNLPSLDEYPVAVYATTLALYTLATDASFDIDIQAPDGVTIPRAERYRQLMEMVQTRKAQYQELCVHLGIGLYSIDVFSLRRVSKTTNRYVPVYKPQEVDDRSFPQRSHIALPTYGDKPIAFPTENGELTAYQGRAWAGSLSLSGKNYAGKSFVAKLVYQRGSATIQTIQQFALEVTSSLSNFAITGASRTSGSGTITLTTAGTHTLAADTAVIITGVDDTVDGAYDILTVGSGIFTVSGTATTALALTGLTGMVDINDTQDYVFDLSLTADQTLRLANRTWWRIETVDPFVEENLVIDEGNFFTVRASEVIL